MVEAYKTTQYTFYLLLSRAEAPFQEARRGLPIAGLISKMGSDVSEPLRQMLATMQHPPQVAISLAVGDHLTRNGTTQIISSLLGGRDKAIGSCGFPMIDDAPVHPIRTVEGRFLLAVEGRPREVSDPPSPPSDRNTVWRRIHEAASSVNAAGTIRDETAVARLSAVMRRLRGSFAVGLLDGQRITVARDVLGVEPLYWGDNARYTGFASARKALWRLGIPVTPPVPPGHVLVITSRTRRLFRAVDLPRPPITNLSLEEAAQALMALLQRVVRASLHGSGGVGVFFSGGVDSALVAKCILVQEVTPVLYVAGFEGAPDLEAARQAADELGCPLRETVISLDEAELFLRQVISAVEQADVFAISIGFPLYVAAEATRMDGVRRVFAGQGADELFGGYARYPRILQRAGAAALADALWADVVHLADRNLQRDKGVALATSIDLVLPFMDLAVIHLASSLPLPLKIASSEDALRKPVLRETARLLGLSETITRRPKKALQYGSGAQKAIQRLAARRGYRRPRDYVTALFREVFPERHG